MSYAAPTSDSSPVSLHYCTLYDCDDYKEISYLMTSPQPSAGWTWLWDFLRTSRRRVPDSRSKDMINWHERVLITIITQRHPDTASTFYFVLFSRVFDLFQNYSSIRHRMHLLVVVTYSMVSWLKKYPSILTHVYWTNASYKQSFDVFGTAEQVITREMKPEFWLHL